MRVDGRGHTCRPGRLDKAGNNLPPSITPGGVPKTFEGTIDEEHGAETPDAPQRRTKGIDSTHWIPVMRARQTDSSRQTVSGGTGNLPYNGHRRETILTRRPDARDGQGWSMETNSRITSDVEKGTPGRHHNKTD